MSEPRLALLDPHGQLEHVTASVPCQADLVELACDARSELAAVLRGKLASASLTVAGLPASAEVVFDGSGARHALVSMGDDADAHGDPLASLLAADIDASPAIVFVKDLDGRYLRVNAAHTALLGGEELIGRTDAELASEATVDGPRQTAPHDSAQLEYIVPAFEGRPALTVLRFLVRDRAGEPVAICGVAAPSAEAEAARTEAERLMGEREADAAAARAAVLTRWGVTPAERPTGETQIEGSVLALACDAPVATANDEVPVAGACDSEPVARAFDDGGPGPAAVSHNGPDRAAFADTPIPAAAGDVAPGGEPVERLERQVGELAARLQASARLRSGDHEREDTERERDAKLAELSEALASDRTRTDELVQAVTAAHERLEDLAGTVSAERAQREVEVQTLRREAERLRRELEGVQAALDMIVARSVEYPGLAASDGHKHASRSSTAEADRVARTEAIGEPQTPRHSTEPPRREPEHPAHAGVPPRTPVNSVPRGPGENSGEPPERSHIGGPSPAGADTAQQGIEPPSADASDLGATAPPRRSHMLASLTLRRLGRRPGAL